jgi:hypothetical protein
MGHPNVGVEAGADVTRRTPGERVRITAARAENTTLPRVNRLRMDGTEM